MTDSFRAQIDRNTVQPIGRPELYARFDAAVLATAGHVVRITAPAGSGKTVLITDWLGNRLHRTRPGTHIGRLTMAGTNSEAVELRTALPQCLGLDPAPPETDSAAHLATALGARGDRTILVIDDAHEITDPESIAFLENFLDKGPANLTTVLAARHDPPLRWHTMELRGGVSHLRAPDLAFSAARVRQLCDRHGYRVTDTELGTIMRLTRGWAALVRIAVRHIATHHDRPTALAELALVPPTMADLFDREILEPLPEHLRRFVTIMSVPIAYTAAQAEYVTGAPSQPFLDELAQLEFPVLHTAREGELWFAYHPLLRAHLLAEFRHRGTKTRAELHARTAEWYLFTDRPMSALPHLLHSPEPEALHEFLREQALRVVLNGNGPDLFQQIEHLRPALTTDPFLRAMRTVAALEQQSIAKATVQLDLLLRRPGETGAIVPNPWLTPLTLAITAGIALATGAGVTEFRIPQRLPTTGQPELDSYTAIQLGTVMMARGDIASADQQFRRGLALADSTGNTRLTMRAATRRAVAAGLGGALGRMRQYAERATDVAAAHDLLDSRDARQAAAVSAFAEYLRGTAPSGIERARLLPGHRLPGGTPAPSAGRYAEVLGRVLTFDTADDQYDAAESLRRGTAALLRQPPLLPAAISRLIPHVTRVLLEADGTHSARAIVDQAGAVLGDTADIVLARALLLIEDRPKTARALVEPLLTAAPSGHPLTTVTAWTVEASAQAALRNPPKARAAIATAVRRAAPEHLVRPFLDVPGACALLDEHTGTFGHDNAFADAVRGHPAVHRPHAQPNLTATELTVLNQLPSGRTAQQIAEILGVSITTVKTHLRGIYAKLGTSSRAGALDLARRSGLL